MKALILELQGEALPPEGQFKNEQGRKTPPPSLPPPTVFVSSSGI